MKQQTRASRNTCLAPEKSISKVEFKNSFDQLYDVLTMETGQSDFFQHLSSPSFAHTTLAFSI
jgi:hypothetical protein